MAQLTYQIDPAHSSVHFSVRHMMLTNVRGHFSKVSGTITVDPEKPANSTVEAEIDAGTIDTREPQRDAHLRSADFLDVEKYPTIVFRSRQVEVGSGGGKVKGDLTLHGVTQEVTLEVEDATPEVKDPWGRQRIGASATAKLSRKAFGLTTNPALETGGVVIGDEIKVSIDIEATRS